MEYGITPEDMQDADYVVGAQIINFGAADQTGVSMDADYTAFTSQSTAATIVSQDTLIMESTETPGLTAGMYTGNYLVTSAEELPTAPEFANNSGVREFEISAPVATANTDNPTYYALDGIGVYTQNTLVGSLGTNSFTGAEDGLVLATQYRIKNAAEISGIRVMLATGTVAGTDQLVCSIKDTATFFQNDMTPLHQTQLVSITTNDINAGFIDVFFDGPITLNAGAYYAAAELYSNAGANTVRVSDDQTVAQPGDASMIYIPGDQIYTNGEALGIRLIMGENLLNVAENTLEGVSVYPNPSTGEFTISNDNNVEATIVVYDLVGKVVYTAETSTSASVNLSSAGAGTYVVKVSSAAGNYTEKVVIK